MQRINICVFQKYIMKNSTYIEIQKLQKFLVLYNSYETIFCYYFYLNSILQ